MAKRLLLDILVKVLGEYIELDAGNFDLSLAVWSGHIELKNLKLRRHKIFRDLGLSVVYGEIKSLEVTIPWTSLLSKPVKVLIDGISLQVGPLDTASLNKKEIREHLISAKLEQLQTASEYLDFTGAASTSKGADTNEKNSSEPANTNRTKATYVQQWTAKIIDNIEITLKNVHIRYEDSQTIPGSIFSAGVTLKSFTLSSCDEKWVEKFIERDLNKAVTAIRKISRINNFGLYWMTKSTHFKEKPFADWSKEMKRLIYSGTSLDGNFFDYLQYMVHPENNLILRLIHDNTDKTSPIFDFIIESSNFELGIDRSQYLQLTRAMAALSYVGKVRHPLRDRPLERPTNRMNCKIWWKYACKLEIKRKKYIRLIKLSKTLDADGQIDARSELEKKETLDLEIWIPLKSLVIFRHACAKEMRKEAADLHASLIRIAIEKGQKPPVMQTVQSPQRSWVGWMTGSKKTDTKGLSAAEDDDVSLESIVASPDHSNGDGEVAQSPVYKLLITTSAVLNLSVGCAPIATATMAVTFTATSSSLGMTATAHMSDLLVIDKCSTSPPIPNIIAVKLKPSSTASSPNTPQKLKFVDLLIPKKWKDKKRLIAVEDNENEISTFSIVYEALNGKKVVRITALPVEITLNKECIQKLIGLFLPSPCTPVSAVKTLQDEYKDERDSHAEAMKELQGRDSGKEHSLSSEPESPKKINADIGATKDRGSEKEKEKEKAIKDADRFEVILEAHAPKIIIPQDSSSDKGYCLLDTGYLAVKGFIGSSGMAFDVSLRNINMAMPHTAEDMYAYGDQSMYLIKPFNLGVVMQTVDITQANMTVEVIIEPGMRGELDPLKLTRLMQMIPVVTETFSQPNCLAAVSEGDLAVYGTLLPVELPPINDENERPSLVNIVGILTEKPRVIVVDPYTVTMLVSIRIAEVALDLLYDVKKGRHLELALRALEMQIIMRPHDMQVYFDMSELSIQDSLRSAKQKDLARTPKGEKKLIHISYVTMSSSLSPLYKRHATDVLVEFSSLALNVDTKTIMNLRPFMEVLLQKNIPSEKGDRSAPMSKYDTASSSTSSGISVSSVMKTRSRSTSFDGQAVKGMHVLFTVVNVSLDLLQACTGDAEGVDLEDTFSLQIKDLRADIDMLDLMSADVTLRSLEISDVRKISCDSAFTKVFCPVVDDVSADLEPLMLDITTPESGTNEKALSNKVTAMKAPNLLHILYSQSSSEVSEVDITVLNVTAFVSMDMVMDLVDVALANANAVMALLAPPSVPRTQQSQPLPGNIPKAQIKPSSAPQQSSNTVNVCVKVVKPNLVLLDDPTTEESRAISASCDLLVHYTSIRKTLPDRSGEISAQICTLSESIHVSVRDNRVSVLLSMLSKQSQTVLEPMGVEISLKKESIDGLLVSSAMSIDIDNVMLRVSTRDVALAQSIMTRRVMVKPAAVKENSNGTVGQAIESPVLISPSTVLSVSMGSLSLVGINDFNGQNTPVVRLVLDGTHYNADGTGDVVSGEGSLTATAEFYNPKLSVWEPMLDKWRPSLSLTTWTVGSFLEIRSDHSLQLTVSGIMLERTLMTYSLFFEHDGKAQRMDVPDMLLCNSLGDGIAFDVYDSATHTKLASLSNLEMKAVPNVQSQANMNHISSMADVIFTGNFGIQREPLRQLPFNINRPRVCNLQNLQSAQGKSSSGVYDEKTQSQKVSIAASAVLEPIVEEAYENARYDPLTTRWVRPYLANDPYEWTDASGTVKRDIKDVQLKSDKWEWRGPWTVEKEALPGEALDNDGWEYSTNFTSFSIANKRRSINAFDCVKRRRWVRTRFPVADSVDERYRPLTVLWDVHVLPSGTKKVELRSGLQVCNSLPFSVMISLGGSVWGTEEELGPIQENHTFNIPLLDSSATWIKIRLADFPYLWCEQVSCSLQPSDVSLIRDVKCEGEGGEEEGYSPVCVRVLCCQQNKSMLITLSPVVTVTNRLPCDLHYQCNDANAKRDEGRLLPGSSCKLANLDISCDPFISLSMGNLQWSIPLAIDPLRTTPSRVEVPAIDGSFGAALTVNITVNNAGTLELSVHSKGVLCDRTGGLGISLGVRNNSGSKIDIIRNTCTPSGAVLTSSPNVPAVERNRRQMQLRAESKAHSKVSKKCLISPRDDSLFAAMKPGAVVVTEGMTSNASLEAAAQRYDVTGITEMPPLSSVLIEMHVGQQTQHIPYGTTAGNSTSPMAITDLSAHSMHPYEVVRADVGARVYTDRSMVWTYLPSQLQKQCSIRTSCDDEMIRAKVLLHFTIAVPSLLLILIDMHASRPPSWVTDDGYAKMSDQAIARLTVGNTVHDVCYSIYGKYLEKGEVVLGANWSGESHYMYSVFAVQVPQWMTESRSKSTDVSDRFGVLSASVNSQHNAVQGLHRMYEEATFSQTHKRSDTDLCWISGSQGVALFHAEDDVVTVGVQGSAWSDEFKIDMASSPHIGSFEAIDWETMSAYQLSYAITYMPGAFRSTQMLTVTPRYCIVNCLDEPLMVVQKGAREILLIEAHKAVGWHKSKAVLGTDVQVRTCSSVWSLGTLDLNEVGRSTVHLPGWETGPGSGPFAISVEVKIAEPKDNCSIVIVIWKAAVETSTAFTISNDSDVPITVCQADIDSSQVGLFEVCVGPSARVPFGWADPDGSTDILVTAGVSMTGAVRVARANILKAGKSVTLSDNTARVGVLGEWQLTVVAEGGGRTVRITRCTKDPNNASDNSISSNDIECEGKDGKEVQKSFGMSFTFASVGVSLVLEKPYRREFLSLYIDGLEGRVKRKGSLCSYELMILDLQIDNYSQTVVYPVLLHSMKKDSKMDFMSHTKCFANNQSSPRGSDVPLSTDDGEDVPLLQVTLIQETTSTANTLKYVALRVMPLSLEVDSATIQLIFSDLISDLKYVDSEETVALESPEKWVRDLNMRLLSPSDRMALVCVRSSWVAAQVSQMYVEKFIIHPMKFTLTFVQTPFPRKTGKDTFRTTALNFLTSLAGVDRMQLKLKSFEVDDMLESSASLVDLLKRKTLHDLQSQLAEIAGSLTVIGSPMGLARKVGSGVKSFFYEPYQGAVLGPQDFIRGLQKGTHHLITNVVSGAMTSTAGIVGSASKGIGFLSGDAEYVRKRSMKNQQDRASRGGIFDGLMDGGESVVSGFTSGVTGLVTKPYEEARKSGVQGFFRGVGLGLMGAALKPVMGVTDGLTSVVSGISNQMDKVTLYVIIRPPRAFERSASDVSDLVLVPLDIDASFAQEFVRKEGIARKCEDTFLCHISTDTAGTSVVLSEIHLYWRRPKVLWGHPWSNISHVFFVLDSVGVVLYGGETEAVIIPCGTQQSAMRVYSALADNARRMGCPSNVIPLDLLLQEDSLSESAKGTLMDRRVHSASLAGVLDEYRFGHVHNTSLKRNQSPESLLIQRIEGCMQEGYKSWAQLDEAVWRLVWEWDCSHTALQASRCCALLVINRSKVPLQIAKMKMVTGRNVIVTGSTSTGYETDSRVVMPGGSVLAFAWAFSPTPIDPGHLKAVFSCAAFSATVSSIQKESLCEPCGGFAVDFLEKTVSEWWSKYVILVT